MTYDEFKTAFPVGAKVRITPFNHLRPRHVVAYHDNEKVVMLKWRLGLNYGWNYEPLTHDKLEYICHDHIRKV